MLSSNGNLTPAELECLRRFDTCTLSNAIERLNIRPRTEGFIAGALTCRFPELPPMIGYAVTAKMRWSMMPVKGRCYYENTDWWRYVDSLGGPRIVVIQDAEEVPGGAALLGEAYARISRALGCVACVTNGAVRDLPGIQALGYQVFAGSVAVSHAYAHVVEFGEPVEIGGLRIHSGDLLHGDLHGVHMIPQDRARELPGIAQRVLEGDREIFELTGREDFSVDMLPASLEERVDKCR